MIAKKTKMISLRSILEENHIRRGLLYLFQKNDADNYSQVVLEG